jgi:hypothetical protein
VPDEDDLGRSVRERERSLLAGAIRALFPVVVGQGFTKTLIEASFFSWTVNASPT